MPLVGFEPRGLDARVSQGGVIGREAATGVCVLVDEQIPDGTRQVSLENRLSSGSALTSTTIVFDTTEKRGPGVQKDPPVVLIAASDRQRSTGYKVAPAGTSPLGGISRDSSICSGPRD